MLKIRRPLGRLIFNMGIAIPGKTVFLIETAPCNATLQIDDNIIFKPEPQVKVLGVMLDGKLNFNDHISALCTKAARQFNTLARISSFWALRHERLFTTVL